MVLLHLVLMKENEFINIFHNFINVTFIDFFKIHLNDIPQYHSLHMFCYTALRYIYSKVKNQITEKFKV